MDLEADKNLVPGFAARVQLGKNRLWSMEMKRNFSYGARKSRFERMRERQAQEQQKHEQAEPLGGFHFNVDRIEAEPNAAQTPPVPVAWRDGTDECDYVIMLEDRKAILKALWLGGNPQVKTAGMILTRQGGLEKMMELFATGYEPIYYHGTKGDHYMFGGNEQYLDTVKLMVRDHFAAVEKEFARIDAEEASKN
jgi:hypothetical protein